MIELEAIVLSMSYPCLKYKTLNALQANDDPLIKEESHPRDRSGDKFMHLLS